MNYTKTASSGYGNAKLSLSSFSSDGYVGFTPLKTNYNMIFGISYNDITLRNQMDYGIEINGKSAQIVELGVAKKEIGTHEATTFYQIYRIGTTISYKRNGMVAWTSTIPATAGSKLKGSVLFDTQYGTMGLCGVSSPVTVGMDYRAYPDSGVVEDPNPVTSLGKPLWILDTQISTLQPKQFDASNGNADITKTTYGVYVNTTTSAPAPANTNDRFAMGCYQISRQGMAVQKTSNTYNWDAGNSTQECLNAGTDGGVFFGTSEINGENGNGSHIMCGLSYVDTNASYNSINYAIYLDNGICRVYENGSSVYNGTSYTIHDTFSVERKNGKIRYSKNYAMFYESLVIPSNNAMVIDTAIYSVNSTITNIRAMMYDSSNGWYEYPTVLLNNVGVTDITNSGKLIKAIVKGIKDSAGNTVDLEFPAENGTIRIGSLRNGNYWVDGTHYNLEVYSSNCSKDNSNRLQFNASDDGKQIGKQSYFPYNPALLEINTKPLSTQVCNTNNCVINTQVDSSGYLKIEGPSSVAHGQTATYTITFPQGNFPNQPSPGVREVRIFATNGWGVTTSLNPNPNNTTELSLGNTNGQHALVQISFNVTFYNVMGTNQTTTTMMSIVDPNSTFSPGFAVSVAPPPPAIQYTTFNVSRIVKSIDMTYSIDGGVTWIAIATPSQALSIPKFTNIKFKGQFVNSAMIPKLCKITFGPTNAFVAQSGIGTMTLITPMINTGDVAYSVVYNMS